MLTGFQVRMEALKGCSAGGWRSGRRRSEGVGGGGTFNLYIGSSVRAGYLLSTSCATKNFSWNSRRIGREDERMGGMQKLAVNFYQQEMILRPHNSDQIGRRDEGSINRTRRP